MADDVEPGPLVVGIRHVPGGDFGVRGGEHGVARPGVVVPAAIRLLIHRGELPRLPAIVDARREATRLLFLAHLEPVLEQDHTRINDRLLDERREVEKAGRLLCGAKSP